MNFLKKKRSIPLLLLVTALLCAAFALVAGAESADGAVTDVTAETLAAAWGAAESGDTLRLTADGTYAGDTLSLAEEKTLTLDLGGHTLTSSKADIGSVISSAGDITVKNGTLAVGEGVTKVIAFSATKGKATLEGVKLLNAVTDSAENTQSFDAFPYAIVSLNGGTVATLTDVYISGKATAALFIANETTLTMKDSTVRNTLNPVLGEGTGTTGKSMLRAAIKVEGAAKVTIEDSRIESVYIGIRFDEQTAANTSEFSMTNSVLHVSFQKDIDGGEGTLITNDATTKTTTNADGTTTTTKTKGHNSGNVYKILMQNGYVTLTLDGVKVTGAFYGKGIFNGTKTEETAPSVTYKNCELYMGGWAGNIYVTFIGNNFILGNSELAWGSGSKAYGVKFEAGAKAYFVTDTIAGTTGTNAQYTATKFNVTSAEDLPTLTTLASPAIAYMRTGLDDTTHALYKLKYVLTEKGTSQLTGAEVGAALAADARCAAVVYKADGSVHAVDLEDGDIYWQQTPNYFGDIPSDGTLRFMKDAAVGDMAKTFTTDAHVDLNGHWLSIGGVTSATKSVVFTLSGDDNKVYFYTSQEGGGIRLLAIPKNASSSWTDGGVSQWPTGTNAMFNIASSAHLHLGYNVNAEGKEEHSDKNFTLVSGVVANLQHAGAEVTVKGGSYYRIFADYFGFVAYQGGAPTTAAFTAENAYFYQTGGYSVIGLQRSDVNFDGTIFKNCVFDNTAVIKASKTEFTATGTITLENCVLTKAPTVPSDNCGVSVVLGEGCCYADAYESDAYKSYFGENDYGILCTPKTVTVTHLKTLKLTELQSGASQANGTATYTFYKTVANEHATVTWKNGEKVVAEEEWKTGDTPAFAQKDLGGGFYLAAYTGGELTEDVTYGLTVKTKGAALMGNLTLYSNITFNLYFPMNTVVTAVNGTALSETVIVKGTEYYIVRLDKTAPKDLYKSFPVGLTVGDGYTCEKTVSLANYAKSVLRTNESTEGNTLVLALLDYVRETAVTLDGAEEAELADLDAILNAESAKAIYERKSWETNENVKNPTAGNIISAALNLNSTPGFVFFLKAETYAKEKTVTMTVNGTEKSYTVHTLERDGEETRYYVLIDNIQAASYRKDLTVVLDGEELLYNFDTYMAGFTSGVPAYANAFYSYLLAAEAYLATQSAD